MSAMQIAARSRVPLEWYVAGVGADAHATVHSETSCRRGCVLACAGDLDLDECLIFLREKSDTVGLHLPLDDLGRRQLRVCRRPRLAGDSGIERGAATYVRASQQEVAAALATLTGDVLDIAVSLTIPAICNSEASLHL